MGKPNSFSLGDVLDNLEPFQPVGEAYIKKGVSGS